MMRAAWLDCFSGVSGNMLLGALIDAGASPRRIRSAAGSVVPEFRLVVRHDSRGHVGGVHVRVECPKKRQPERRLPHIVKMIKGSGLPAPVREKSVRVFERLAAAEARVHRVKPEEVHFHEVGAVDAMVDVVGSVFGFYELGVEKLVCSPLPLSPGEVQCRHGTLPLPAPAVAELLRGAPVRGVAVEGELVTPTGAALAVTLSSCFGPMPAMTLWRTGTGLGDREIEGRPNLLRLMVGEMTGPGETVFQIEAAIDDMPGEHFDFLLDKLHAAGALEVLYVPAQMKKNRPGVLVRALATGETREPVMAALFHHSTTLGARVYEVSRSTLPRKTVTARTRFGKVSVKVAEKPDGSVRVHPEYDDLKKAAQRAGVSLEKVEKAVRDALAAKTGKK